MSDSPAGASAPRPRPGPRARHAVAPPAPVRRPGRRGFLIAGGAAVVVGAGAGVGGGFTWHRPEPPPPAAPDPALVAAVRAAVGVEMLRAAAAASVRPQSALLRHIAANHAEHERVLRALLPDDALTDLPVPSAATATLAQVRAAESTAARNAAAAAAKLTGRAAVLLACIGACEAAHADLLS